MLPKIGIVFGQDRRRYWEGFPGEYGLWIGTREDTRKGFSWRILSLDKTREGTWEVRIKSMEKPLV